MLLVEKNGISCDLCGAICRHDFSYYSIEVCTIQVKNGITVHRSGVITNFDSCCGCYDKMMDKCRNNLHTNARSIKCESCGKLYTGNFEYLYLVMHRATINPPIGMSIEGDEFQYEIKTEKNMMDLRIDKECYDTMKKCTKENRDAYQRSIEEAK